MSDPVSRFQRRRQAQRAAADAAPLTLLPPADAALRLRSMPVDVAFVDAPGADARFDDGDMTSDPGAAQALLDELAADFNAQRFSTMVDELQGTVLSTVAGAFGLGKLVSALDREGGDVDTVHNARQGVYASDKERDRYDNRESYDKDAVHKHKKYRAANEAMKASRDAGTLQDTYTGERIAPGDRNDRQRKPNLDHVVAARNVHDDAGRVLAELNTADLANVAGNHAPTAQTVNAKKRAHDAEQLTNILEREAPGRRARLVELEKDRSNWTDKERKEFEKLSAQDKIDLQQLRDKEEEAQAAITAEVNKSYYTSGKFARATALAGLAGGAKASVQQALGVVVVEFLSSAIAEIRDLYKRGMEKDSLIGEARVRLSRIAKRVGAARHAALAGLRDGFIAGLLASLATTLINAFVTTATRVVRMIREGFMSLLRAVKLLLVRPEGMTTREALHEASKVVVGTLGLVGGIALEEVISKQLALVPGVALVAEPAGAAIAGALTAILTSFAVYLLDKMDLFNVVADARHAAVGRALDARLAATIERLDELDGWWKQPALA